MTNHTPQNNASDPSHTSTYNVISVSFDPDDNAYAAITALKELEAQDRLGVEAGAVIVRGEDGQIEVKDRSGSPEFVATGTGGLLGLLLGVIGGPLGVLIGGTYGLMVGSLFDLAEIDDNESVLSQMSASVKPGRPVVLAEVVEQSPEVVDTAMARLGGTVLRRPVDEVQAEIAAAEQAEEEARRKATEELLRGRRDRTKEQVSAKVEQLKAKLPQRAQATTGA